MILFRVTYFDPSGANLNMEAYQVLARMHKRLLSELMASNYSSSTARKVSNSLEWPINDQS